MRHRAEAAEKEVAELRRIDEAWHTKFLYTKKCLEEAERRAEEAEKMLAECEFTLRSLRGVRDLAIWVDEKNQKQDPHGIHGLHEKVSALLARRGKEGGE